MSQTEKAPQSETNPLHLIMTAIASIIGTVAAVG